MCVACVYAAQQQLKHNMCQLAWVWEQVKDGASATISVNQSGVGERECVQ